MHGSSCGFARQITGRTAGSAAVGATLGARCVRVGGRRSVVVFAADGGGNGDGKGKQSRKQAQDPTKDDGFSLGDVNPYELGRRSRALFDDVWQQFTKLSSPTQSIGLEDNFRLSVDDLSGSVFETPQAGKTTVLVAGATGRVGRILVRKLLLRGYMVRALVRRKESLGVDAIPQSVEVVYGDVGDYDACKKAVEGVDKIVCCIGARSDLTADLSRVEDQGVYNLGKAFLDRLVQLQRSGLVAGKTKARVADSRDPRSFSSWKVERLGMVDGFSAAARRVFDRGQDSATLAVDEESGQLVFTGVVRSRGGLAEAAGDLALVSKAGSGGSMAGTEGLVLRVCGDGNQYTVILATAEGAQYSAKLATRMGYQTARLPFNIFRPVNTDTKLDPAELSRIMIRFEPRVGRPAVVVGNDDADKEEGAKGEFRVAIDFIKALPGGQETDFILVSCAGAPRPGQDAASREKMIAFKRRGETKLRNSGLGYTIVRPGPMVEEPGGYRALVFDQGNRISQGISYADVADVALKALHDPMARNKAFEVCYEYTPEQGLEMYELVAHLPDKANNYLSPALATLEKNT